MPKNAGDVPRSAQASAQRFSGRGRRGKWEKSWNINELKKSAKRRAKAFSIIQRAYKGQSTALPFHFLWSASPLGEFGELRNKEQETLWLPPSAGATECHPVFLFHL